MKENKKNKSKNIFSELFSLSKHPIFVTIFSIIVIIFTIIIIIYNYFILPKKIGKNNFINQTISLYNDINDNKFRIDHLISYSSGFGNNKNESFQTDSWVLDLFQYTDFGLYITPTNDSYVKKLWIDQFILTKEPALGNVTCYYNAALQFGTNYIAKDYIFNDKIEYTVLNDSNDNNSIDYSTPIFFADCSTPICIKYVNNILNNYSLNNTRQITQDGKLLTNAINDAKVLEARLNFKVHIIDNHDEHYVTNVILDIPTENLLTSGSSYNMNNNFGAKFIRTNRNVENIVYHLVYTSIKQ